MKLARDYTAIEITSNNQSGNSYYQWCNINRNTYILVNGTKYTLTRTDGIEIAPEKHISHMQGKILHSHYIFHQSQIRQHI